MNFLDDVKILASYERGVRVTLDHGYEFMIYPLSFDPEDWNIQQLTPDEIYRLDHERELQEKS